MAAHPPGRGARPGSFTLSGAAAVTFTLRRLTPGAKTGKKCVGAPKPFAAKASTAKRSWKPHGLAPGSYRLTATPAAGSGETIRLKVLAP